METWATVWLAFAGFACAVDLFANYQRSSGKLGETVRTQYLMFTALMGGWQRLFWIIVFSNFLVPPVALVVCVATYRIDLQTYKRECSRD